MYSNVSSHLQKKFCGDLKCLQMCHEFMSESLLEDLKSLYLVIYTIGQHAILAPYQFFWKPNVLYFLSSCGTCMCVCVLAKGGNRRYLSVAFPPATGRTFQTRHMPVCSEHNAKTPGIL